MAGQPISDLIVAAKNLTSVLYAGYEEHRQSQGHGIVPFAGSVNVGAANRGVSWVGSGGLSPVHSENCAEQRTRFELFAELGVSWGGCVRCARAHTTSLQRVEAGAMPASLFVPMFAPDEPDPANAEGTATATTIRSDTGGRWRAPTPTCVRVGRRGRCASVVDAPRCPPPRPRPAPANTMAAPSLPRQVPTRSATVERSCR